MIKRIVIPFFNRISCLRIMFITWLSAQPMSELIQSMNNEFINGGRSLSFYLKMLLSFPFWARFWHLPLPMYPDYTLVSGDLFTMPSLCSSSNPFSNPRPLDRYGWTEWRDEWMGPSTNLLNSCGHLYLLHFLYSLATFYWSKKMCCFK